MSGKTADIGKDESEQRANVDRIQSRQKNKTKGVDGEIRRDSDFTTMWVEGVPGREHSVLDQVGHRQVEMKRRRGRVRQLLGIELEDTNQTFWGKCCRYLTAQLSKRPGHQLRAEARFPWS